MCAAVDIIGKKVGEVLSLPPSPHWWKVQHAPVDSDMECPLLGHPRGEHSTLAHIPAFPNCGWHPPLMERCSAPAASWQQEEEEAVKEVNEARLFLVFQECIQTTPGQSGQPLPNKLPGKPAEAQWPVAGNPIVLIPHLFPPSRVDDHQPQTSFPYPPPQGPILLGPELISGLFGGGVAREILPPPWPTLVSCWQPNCFPRDTRG